MNIPITNNLIRAFAAPEVLRRGRELFLQDAVRLAEVTENAVRARVRTTRIFTVSLRASDHEPDARCTCGTPRGRCEHAAAVLFEVRRRQDTGEDLTPDETDWGGLAGADGQAARVPKWAKSLARILGDASQQIPPSTGRTHPWRLAFVLQVHKGKRKISPLRVRVRKDGSVGQVSLLQNAGWHDPGVLSREERVLLDKMNPSIETSVDVDEDEPYQDADAHLSPLPENLTARENFRWNDVLLLLEGRELYLAGRTSLAWKRLSVDGRPGTLAFTIAESGRDLSFSPEIEWPDMTVPVSDDLIVLSGSPLWVLVENRVRLVGNARGEDLLRLNHILTPIIVPAKDREIFLARALPSLLERYPLRSGGGIFRSIEGPPVPRLYLGESRANLHIRLRFWYGNAVEIAGEANGSVGTGIHFSENAIVSLRRDTPGEEAVRGRLVTSGLRPINGEGNGTGFVPAGEPLQWLTDHLPVLIAEGYEVYGQETLARYRLRSGAPKIAFTISSGIDWFDLNVAATFEGTAASLQAFVEAVREGRRYVRLADGSYGVLTEEFLKRFKAAALFGDARNEGLRFSRSHVALLDDLSASADVIADDGFGAVRARLASFTGIEHKALPGGFRATLRPYQQSGYDWLRFLHEFRFGGLLADDMGLGKTVQTLALLAHIHQPHAARPSLIVVPTSLVHNWQREALRFAPDLRVLTYHGLDRKRFRNTFESFDVVVTSYGILRRDAAFLRDIPFTYVILDESQNIKNFASVNARAARAIQAEHRLALTGTPVENNLSELWSQMHFLNPGMLGGLKTFTDHFIRAIERDHDEPTAASLRRIIRPFLLRRTKELVAADLPSKFESTVLCDMDEAQRSAYQHWREYYRQAILRSIDAVGIRRSTVKVLEGLMKLRLVCCHPALADDRYRGSSGKFSAFEEMLDDILQEGHKVLVFSQFVRMLTLLRRHLDRHGVPYEYLDGRTTHRKTHVDRFQNDPDVRAFLISLRAGGTGLNLTAADYVIHYDPWWNPAVEAQATDRTHRIGQTRQVFSYKLITRDTVEEKIVELQEKKKDLVSSVITTEQNFLKSLTREDIDDLFS
jgi:non-specific serine/threonine protein kinase